MKWNNAGVRYKSSYWINFKFSDQFKNIFLVKWENFSMYFRINFSWWKLQWGMRRRRTKKRNICCFDETKKNQFLEEIPSSIFVLINLGIDKRKSMKNKINWAADILSYFFLFHYPKNVLLLHHSLHLFSIELRSSWNSLNWTKEMITTNNDWNLSCNGLLEKVVQQTIVMSLKFVGVLAEIRNKFKAMEKIAFAIWKETFLYSFLLIVPHFLLVFTIHSLLNPLL
jgi:hypothetical protein